jgi:catechol 2,3-dioxygenase
MVRGYPGALFVSAGGYHHHVGLNTWHSAGAAPATEGSVGLRSFTVELPSEAERDAVVARVRAAGIATSDVPEGVLVHDPFGTAVILTARAPA